MLNARQSTSSYRGADTSLARPGRKQATTEYFEFRISFEYNESTSAPLYNKTLL
jgi:hypothetical protein